MTKVILGESSDSVVPNSAWIISEAVSGQKVIGSDTVSDSIQQCDDSLQTSRCVVTNDYVQQCDTSSQQCSDAAPACDFLDLVISLELGAGVYNMYSRHMSEEEYDVDTFCMVFEICRWERHVRYVGAYGASKESLESV
ncbi:hypothetical protein V6N11_034144 [Hibiscus sabdariffa]|uniref:Uncharacterized protein n=1 Tax=Hibiscus sabdariffa TaxID=183260 RepID=A0ABR2S1I0_9ROSI